jgi:hypothetical protein
VGNQTKQNFFKGRSPNGQKAHEKKCSPSLTVKEMQIKTTLRFYLTPLRITIIKNTKTTNVGKDTGKKEPSYTAGENAS